MKSFIIISLFAVLNFGLAVKLPSSWKRCKVSLETDNKPNECLRLAMQQAFSSLIGDNKELGAYGIDPLKIKEIIMNQGDSNGAIKGQLKYTNNELQGIATNTKVKKVYGKLSNPKNFELTFELLHDKVSLIGPYTVSGNVLILPITGEGLSNMTLVNVKGVSKIIGKSQIKNGKEYLKITDYKVTFDADRVYIRMDNLFNGNKALGDSMNRFIDQHWKEIFDDLKPSYFETFAKLFEDYAKRILERIPYKDIFLVE